MTTQEFKNAVNEIIENENVTFASAAKEYAKEKLALNAKLDCESIGIEDAENYSFIYELEDGYVIIIDTYEEDFTFFTKEVDEAQKLATDKLYEFSV